MVETSHKQQQRPGASFIKSICVDSSLKDFLLKLRQEKTSGLVD